MFKRTIEKEQFLPWVEKYRPSSLDEIKGHEWNIKALKNFIEKGKIPHMVFTGPAGTGKTSSAIALVRDLLGKDFTPDQILEMNASDNVRMDTVKNEIKSFTSTRSFSGKNTFKLIILDESDNIPKEPQQALRRIIEKSPPNVKFIFMCNYENRLIDPILSRCALFRFTPLPKKIVLNRLKEIGKSEKLSFTEDFYDVLYSISSGDLRKAVNLLQMASQLDIKGKSGNEKMYKVAGFLSPTDFQELTSYLTSGEFTKAVKVINENKGFSGRNVLLQFLEWINNLNDKKIEIEQNKGYEYVTMRVLEALGEIDFRITSGSEQDLQMEAILGFISEIFTLTSKQKQIKQKEES